MCGWVRYTSEFVHACVRACVRMEAWQPFWKSRKGACIDIELKRADHSRDELFRREIVEAEEPALARAIVGAAVGVR